MEKINGDNLCIGKTFVDFMESVKKELERIVNKNENIDSVTILLENCDSFTRDEGIEEPAMSVTINSNLCRRTYFTVANFEFDRFKSHRKALKNLIQVRFIDCLYYLEDKREILFQVLKQFDSKWETPSCYEH